jgi:hypothetical protein
VNRPSETWRFLGIVLKDSLLTRKIICYGDRQRKVASIVLAFIKHCKLQMLYSVGVGLGGLVVSVLATGPKVSGFDGFFKGDKNP